MPTLVLIRGVPGAGKSTYAKKHFPKYAHFEADMYFTDGFGNYTWTHDKTKQAHDWCIEQTIDNLLLGIDVVVSNTFIKSHEVIRYLEAAKTLRNAGHIISIKILRMKNRYECQHLIPLHIIEQKEKEMVPVFGEVFVE